jgi:DNA-binding XRE family transcriptional regulator
MKTHKWADIKRSRFSPERLAKIRKDAERELLELNLAELRKELGLTQEQVADAAEMSQGELSRLERRDDHLVSTLRRYVESLGGELEVTAVVGKKRVKLAV